MTRPVVTLRGQATDNRTVSGELTAAAQYVGPYRYRKLATDRELNQVHLVISGTWVGTMLLQTSFPNREEWVTVTDGTFASNASEGMSFGGSVDVRLYCSAYTSGTCFAAISNE